MAQPIDFSQFNFSAEEIRSIRELVFDAVLESPDLNIIHTFYPGIVYDRQIGFIGEGSIVGKRAQGCNPEPQEFNIATRALTWSPKRWGVELQICYTDLEQTMVVYSLKQGVEISDLTGTDYMAIVVDLLTKAIKKMIWRFLWFGDTDAENYIPAEGETPASGGIITPGIDVEYLDLIDGFWKQLKALSAGNSQLVPVSANTAATTAAQFANMTGQMAYDTLNKLHLSAPVILRNQANLNFYCTQSFADAYMTYLEGKELDATYENLVEGVRALKFRGYNLIPIQIWDEMIATFENLGAKLNNPHRVVFTTKDILAVGIPSTGILDTVDLWYEKTTKQNHLRAEDGLDAKVLRNDFFMLGI
ncbi:MAG: hypothetical protein LBP85_07220 [Prevotellaceae bacterium]|jgi:hypothetical protein|nr:hypothetical protein [Prevotellaceae bacterium]